MAIKILAAIDFTDCSKNALTIALNLVETNPLEVVLLFCYSPVWVPEDFPAGIHLKTSDDGLIINQEEVIVQLYEQMDRLKLEILQSGNLKNHPSIQIRSLLVDGYPEDQIPLVAGQFNPDLITIGASHRANSITELMGSIASDVIQRTKYPVLTVPSSCCNEGFNSAEVLYLADFRSSDFGSLHQLIQLISAKRRDFYCVHFSHEKPDKWDEKRITELQSYCNETYRNQPVSCEMVIGEKYMDTINRYIQKKQINLIAMTRVKRNLISTLLHPDIARQLLFHSQVPVLIFNE